jgi:hypothetical protein
LYVIYPSVPALCTKTSRPTPGAACRDGRLEGALGDVTRRRPFLSHQQRLVAEFFHAVAICAVAAS